jgi:Sec7-like guanine-nucleotide exchange factor
LEKILEETKQKLEQTLANKANNGPKKGFALRNENHFIQSLQAKIITAREILKYRKTQKN